MQPFLRGYMIKEDFSYRIVHMLINVTLFSYPKSPCDLAEAHLQPAHSHSRLIQMALSHHNQLRFSIFNPVIKELLCVMLQAKFVCLPLMVGQTERRVGTQLLSIKVWERMAQKSRRDLTLNITGM